MEARGALAPPPATLARRRGGGTAVDRRAELLLGAIACSVLALIAGMVVFVMVKAWPSFANNGFAWFGSGGGIDQQLQDIFNSPSKPDDYVYTIRVWPLIYGTLLTTGVAVVVGVLFSLFAAIFIVEFAPAPLRRLLEPIVQLLAGVPSVVYGLIGILVLAPWIGGMISEDRKQSVAQVVQLTGANWTVAALILTVMIVPIMIAIIVDSLRAVPRSWTEGAAALGVNRWRVLWTVSVRAIRPAIVAAAILATARALGEAIMLSMVSGSIGFAPNPLDGLTLFFEPTRPLAATIVDNREGLSVIPFGQTLYAFAAILLVSSVALSFIGWAVKRRLAASGVHP